VVMMMLMGGLEMLMKRLLFAKDGLHRIKDLVSDRSDISRCSSALKAFFFGIGIIASSGLVDSMKVSCSTYPVPANTYTFFWFIKLI